MAGLVIAVLWLIAPLALSLIPLPQELLQPPAPFSLELVDRKGRALREVGQAESIQLQFSLSQVPQSLIDSTLAAEDHRFWQHQGVDWRACARAAWGWIKNGRIISGGSTITQQLIKLSHPRPRTLFWKMIEALQALRLEQDWSKEQILGEYLQRLEYGNARQGSSSAAQYYFSQSLTKLSTAQAAFLAGLPQAPSRLNPHHHFARAKKRQEWILGRMRVMGKLDEAAYRRSLEEPIRLAKPTRNFQAPHFVELFLSQEKSIQKAPRDQPITTSLDLDIQQTADEILRRQLNYLRDHHVRNGAVVVIENETGGVLALVGSGDYFEPASGQVNGAYAPRSAGSTFKPFTYLIAMEQGATPASLVADVPTEFATASGLFAPVNYNRHCYGPLRFRLALANSLNIPAVKVLESIGGPEVLLDRLRSCGLTTLDQTASHYGLGLTIGNAEARLLELVNAYACLARLGYYRPYTQLMRPLTPSSSSMAQRSFLGDQIFSPDAAYLIADILSDNSARALAFGLDSSLRLEFPVACKTGTSTGFRDNWAIGYTPEFTVGVWIGNFDGTPMEEISGVTGAAPVLREMFQYLHQEYGTTWYAPPQSIVQKTIHPITGKLVDPAFPGALQEKFVRSNLPLQESPEDYDVRGLVRLPEEYRAWLGTSDNWLAGRIALEEPKARRLDFHLVKDRVRITSPLPGSVYSLDPDLPERGALLRLQATGSRTIAWHSGTLTIQTNHLGFYARLTPGKHELTASDAESGMTSSTWIMVENL